MINIANFKVLKGYEYWKTVFMKEDVVKMREEAGVNILQKDSMNKMKGCTLCKTWIQWKSSKMLWQKTKKK